jgi:hypothetical protein
MAAAALLDALLTFHSPFHNSRQAGLPTHTPHAPVNTCSALPVCWEHVPMCTLLCIRVHDNT